MADIWQKFLQLPRAVRNAASTPEAMQTIERLEQTYPGVDLAGFVMRVLIKDLPLDQLPSRLVLEGGVNTEQARGIANELSTTIFTSLQGHLGTTAAPPPVQMESLKPLGAPNVPAAPTSPVGKWAPTPALSPEDDQEIISQRERIKSMAQAPLGIDESAQQVLNQHQLAFPDEMLTKRALSIFKARLKGIRDDKQTTDMLTRDPKIGGLGMDPDVAGNVVRSLSAIATDLKNRGMAETPVVVLPPPPPMVPKIETVHPEPKPPLTRAFPTEPAPPQPKAVPQPSTQVPPAIHRPIDIPPPMGLSNPKPEPIRQAPSVVSNKRMMERPSVSDITKPSRALGPSEEMRSLSLLDFRRLGTGATDSAKKLLDKFHHLKSDSFKLWSDAVAGWRQSEVHQLYLEMGRQSLEQNFPIKEVIQIRARQNQPYLSEHEFLTVADLNRQLMP